LSRRRFLTRAVLLAATTGAFAVAGGCSSAPATPSAGSTPAASSAAAPTQAPATAATPAPKPTTAPAAAAASGGASSKRGGTLTALVQNDWVSMDPIFETGVGSGFNMLYDTWIDWVKDPQSGRFGPKPRLFAEWDLKATEVVLKLQSGVKFHDGTSLDAKAAKWNLDRLFFHPQSKQKADFANLDVSKEDPAELDKMKAEAAKTFNFSSKAVEIVDDLTLKLHFTKPMAPLLATLGGATNYSPISPTAYNQLGRDAFATKPVGCGPFKFSEWQKGTRLVLERNPDYWKKGADGQALPYLDKLIYRLVIDDSVRLLEVKSGNAQFTESVQAKDIAGLKSDPSFILLEVEDQGVSHRMPFDGKNPDSPFVKHPELRKAMLYAMNREAMAKTLGFDAAIADRYMFAKGTGPYDESIPYYNYDKAKAQQIVKDVLAKDPSLAAADGKIHTTLSVISRLLDKQQSEIIKQMASEVGFDLKIDVMERAEFVAKLVQLPGKPGGNYEVATVQNPYTGGDLEATLRSVYYSKGGQNYPHIGSFDELIDKGASTYDEAERIKVYKDFEQLDYDLALMGYLWFQKYNWVRSNKVQNFREPPGSQWDFSDVWLS
jgi:ABC-type transport system substrate-binding protein